MKNMTEKIEIYSIRLREMRKEKGYTQSELAGAVNSNKQTISNIERKFYKSINKGLLDKIARSLSCTADYLIGLSEVPNKSATVDGKHLILPIAYDYIANPLKNRLFDLCQDNIALLDKIVTYLEKAPAKHKQTLSTLLDFMLSLT